MLWDMRGCDRYVIWDIGDNILRQAIVGQQDSFCYDSRYCIDTSQSPSRAPYTDRNLVKVFPRDPQGLDLYIFTESYSSHSSHCHRN